MGSGIPLDCKDDDLTLMCETIVHEVRLLNPDRAVLFQPDHRIVGIFDTSRLGQAFSNLIGNAIKHGSLNAPVTVSQRLQVTRPCSRSTTKVSPFRHRTAPAFSTP